MRSAPGGRKPPAPKHRSRSILLVVAAVAFLVGVVNVLRLHEASARLLRHDAPQRDTAVSEASSSSANAGHSESACIALKEGSCAEEMKPPLANASNVQGSEQLGSPSGARSAPPAIQQQQWSTAEMRQQGTFVLASLRQRVKQTIDDWRKVPRSDAAHGALWPSCAIVGNSGNLINAGHGADIDRHAMVLRINNSPVKGHEEDVGSTTSISLLNGWKMHWCGERERCPCWPYGLGVAILTYVWEPFMRQDIKHCRDVQPRSYIVAVDDAVERLANRIAREYTERRLRKLPKAELTGELDMRRKVKLNSSTGLLAVVLSFGLCESLSLFGFNRNASQHHFFENRTQHEYLDHDYVSEVDFYRELADGTAPLGRFYPLPKTRLVE